VENSKSLLTKLLDLGTIELMKWLVSKDNSIFGDSLIHVKMILKINMPSCFWQEHFKEHHHSWLWGKYALCISVIPMIAHVGFAICLNNIMTEMTMWSLIYWITISALKTIILFFSQLNFNSQSSHGRHWPPPTPSISQAPDRWQQTSDRPAKSVLSNITILKNCI